MPDNPIPPPPPPPAGKRPGDGDILVLLVGINKYATINPLKGCIADLNRIEKYLKSQYDIADTTEGVSTTIKRITSAITEESEDTEENGIATEEQIIEIKVKSYAVPIKGYRNLKICRLEEEAATYQNIIDIFQFFLQPASVVD